MSAFDDLKPGAGGSAFDSLQPKKASAFDALTPKAASSGGEGLGSRALDLLARPGNATEAALARGPGAGLQTLMHSEDQGQHQTDRDTIKSALHVKRIIDALPDGPIKGTVDTLIDTGLDPTTYLGGLGVFEKGANLLGRAGITGAAKGIEAAGKVSPKLGEVLGTAHDVFVPGGSQMGALKRDLILQHGGKKGQDAYAVVKSMLKADPGDRSAPYRAFARGDIERVPQKIPVRASSAPSGPLAGLAKAVKAGTRGTTEALFALPQIPGLQGHGSNVLQTGIFSHPSTALGATLRYAGSGEYLPGAARTKFQALPGIRNIVASDAARRARAAATGAIDANPHKSVGFLDKIPGVKNLAEYSSRTLWGYDDAVKAALNDHYVKQYLKAGANPTVAKAKAAERVGQDMVDYADTSDINKGLSTFLPFATYATKKPGVVARAVARHPERVLAITRNNPDFAPNSPRLSEDDPSAGRPLTSIYNALNGRSQGSKLAEPFPGAQYVRSAAGAPLRDLAIALGSGYMGYRHDPKQVDWRKLLATQALGNLPAGAGDAILDATGLNYFGR